MPPTTTEPPAVAKPPHPLYAMTTYELRGYRRELEAAIAYFDKQTPVPAARGELQAALDAVAAEEADRRRIARANGA